MDKLYSYCMKNNLMVIVDGTFANEKITETNIGQCKKHQRDFGIILIYQDPVISYAFTKARELDMERNVPKEVFVRKYYQSFANVFAVLKRHPDVPFLVAYKRKSGKFSAMRSIRTKSRFDSRF